MRYVGSTKLRLIRGVVDDNINVLQGSRSASHPNIAPPLKRRTAPWLGASLLISLIAYFTAPSPMAWKRAPAVTKTASAISHKADSAVAITRTAPQDVQAEPRALDREAIPLSIKKIVIDAGHGGKQPGAISDSGISEKQITLDIAHRLRQVMEKGPFEVLMTRQGDQTLGLEKRVAFANSNNADLFVSIHVNWTEPRALRPLETYYVGPSDDPATIHLTSQENRDSGYSLSDYRRLLERIYMDNRRDESRKLAGNIHSELYHSLRLINPNVDNRGVKMAPFLVLVETQMPAILVEVSSLSNEDEVALLTKPEYQEKIALAIFRGIRSYANSLNGTGTKGS
jgi:N-acetylmuramoyl-L-alanine amidase